MAAEWHDTTIEELASPVQGGIAIGPFGSRMKCDCYVSEGVRVVRGTNLNEGRRFRGEFVFITEEKAKSLGSSMLQPYDLVFPHRGSIGEVGIVPDDGLRYVMSTSLMKLTCDQSKVRPDFLYYFFRSDIGRHALLQNQSQVGTPGIGQPLTSLKSITIRLPDLVEQDAVAALLRTLDDKIEILKKTNETIEAIAQAIFKSWFVDFDPVRAKAEGREPDGMDAATAALFPDEFQDSELGEIPLGWNVKEIGNVSISNQKSIGKDYAYPEIEYVDISSVEPGRIATSTKCNLSEAPSRAKRLVSDGDTIWSCVRPNRRSYALVIEPTDSLVVSTGFVTLTATEVPFSFLYLSVTTSQFVEYLTLRADGAAYPAVRPDTFESAKVTIPAKSIANRFHEIVEPILRTIAANDKQAKSLADLRDTLLPRLISGKLRVPEAEAMLTRV